MLKLSLTATALMFAISGAAIGCAERNAASTKVETKDRDLSAELDQLENDWIRLKARAEGKGEVRQELDVAADEIEEEFDAMRAKIREIETSEEKESIERDLENGISKMKQSLKNLGDKIT